MSDKPGHGGIHIASQVISGSVWGSWRPFRRPIAPGEQVAITFAWGDGRNRVYLNDALLADVYADFREEKPIDPVEPFGEYLAAVDTLQIGADRFKEDNTPMDASVLASVVIGDQPLPEAQSVPVILSFSDDTFKVPGISGKLVAGDRVTATMKASPGGTACVAA